MHLDTPGIENLVKEYERDTKAIKEELLRLCWYMRGGLNYTESHLLTSEERDIINKIVQDNLKITKEQGIPFF